MALTTKRIIALPSQSDPQEGDYLAIDNATSGTHKIPVGRIGVEVDDTLTEAGKAADAKAVGDALDEIRSQIEVTGTASGAIATFTDGSAMPAKSVIVNIEPQQSGTGTPSPDNVRQISGWAEVEVIVSPTQEATDGHTTTTSLGRTVYGGTLDVVTGVLTVTWAMVTINGSSNFTQRRVGTSNSLFGIDLASGQGGKAVAETALPNVIANELPLETAYNAWRNETPLVAMTSTGNTIWFRLPSITALADAKTYLNSNPLQVCYELATPQTYTLTGQEISTLLGENNVWADSGDVEVVYVRDLNLAINNLLNNSGTRSLGMTMSAPTENTTEEPTDEPSEDDMR